MLIGALFVDGWNLREGGRLNSVATHSELGISSICIHSAGKFKGLAQGVARKEDGWISFRSGGGGQLNDKICWLGPIHAGDF